MIYYVNLRTEKQNNNSNNNKPKKKFVEKI